MPISERQQTMTVNLRDAMPMILHPSDLGWARALVAESEMGRVWSDRDFARADRIWQSSLDLVAARVASAQSQTMVAQNFLTRQLRAVPPSRLTQEQNRALRIMVGSDEPWNSEQWRQAREMLNGVYGPVTQTVSVGGSEVTSIDVTTIHDPVQVTRPATIRIDPQYELVGRLEWISGNRVGVMTPAHFRALRGLIDAHNAGRRWSSTEHGTARALSTHYYRNPSVAQMETISIRTAPFVASNGVTVQREESE